MDNLPLDQIICADNCDALGTLPRDCIDLVVTSPPYDDLRTYGGHSWDFYGVAWQLKRVLKPGGVIVWVVNDATVDGGETGTSWRQAHHFQTIGLRIHDTMIWKKDLYLPQNNARYEQAFEYCFIVSKGKPVVFNPITESCVYAGRTRPSSKQRQPDGTLEVINGAGGEYKDTKPRCNVWSYTGSVHSTKDSVAFNHPAIFPEDLARDHIISWSNEGDIVLDPFGGSGTTAKMARELGRRYISIEVNPEYCEIQRKRLSQQLLFGPGEVA